MFPSWYIEHFHLLYYFCDFVLYSTIIPLSVTVFLCPVSAQTSQDEHLDVFQPNVGNGS